MKPIAFNQVDRWAELAKSPLDETLEKFQEDYFGDFHHWYYRFFYHMVKETKPAIALEIGIDRGHTLAHMAAGNPKTMVIGIDRRVGCANGMPFYSNVTFIYANSLSMIAQMTVKRMVNKFGKISVVFQDSSHHYEASKNEFEIYSQFLGDNAIWCCDDITPAFYNPRYDPRGKGMNQYFNELPGRKKLYDRLHHGSIIGVALL